MHATWKQGSEAGWELGGGLQAGFAFVQDDTAGGQPGLRGRVGGLNCGCSRVFYYIKYYVSPDSQFYVLFRV